MYRGKIKQVHFVGIGGSGMSGIAEVLHNLGYRVTGSDLKPNKATKRLEELGCKVFYGHDPRYVEGADVVVVSSAVPFTNPEVQEALKRGIPVIPRAEMLAELMRMKYGIAVAGSHGKTTTTSMIAQVLAHGGFDPTAVIGGRVKGIGGGARLGAGEFLVAEADESDGSFLSLIPTIVVITNIDREHVNFYGTFERLKEAFVQFANKVPFYGVSILCWDHPVVREVIPLIKKRKITYGLSDESQVKGVVIEKKQWMIMFRVYVEGKALGEIRLKVLGEHNVQNALAALACGLELGIPFEVVKEALEDFKGVERRLEIKGEAQGIMVVDDYAHHPEEIKASLKALSQLGRRIIAVFQPHRYTRLKDLFTEFTECFDGVALLILTEVYPAGEEPIEGVSGLRLYERLKEKVGDRVLYVEEREKIPQFILPILKEGDVVVTLGAGNISEVSEELVRLLEG
jgi:UDP-N-acetylmuramate--alanine ligase